MTNINLYGMVPGVHFNYLDFKENPINPKLEKHIKNLPKGIPIGIQSFLKIPTKANDLREKDWKIIKADPYLVKNWINKFGIIESFKYFDKISSFCEKNNHPLIFLDDSEIYKKNSDVYRKLYSLKSKLTDRSSVSTLKKALEIVDKLFDYQVKIEHLGRIDHPQQIIKNIIRESPETVILNNQLADYVITDGEKLNSQGINLTYWRETYDYQSGRLMEINMERNPFLPNSIRLELNSLEIKISIAEKGRVVEKEKDPDYIGTWKPCPNLGTVLQLPKSGLFEVYIDEENPTTGEIEDCFGKASFYNAKFTPDRITFIKKYDKNVLDLTLPGGYEIINPIAYTFETKLERYLYGKFSEPRSKVFYPCMIRNFDNDPFKSTELLELQPILKHS